MIFSCALCWKQNLNISRNKIKFLRTFEIGSFVNLCGMFCTLTEMFVYKLLPGFHKIRDIAKIKRAFKLVI